FQPQRLAQFAEAKCLAALAAAAVEAYEMSAADPARAGQGGDIAAPAGDVVVAGERLDAGDFGGQDQSSELVLGQLVDRLFAEPTPVRHAGCDLARGGCFELAAGEALAGLAWAAAFPHRSQVQLSRHRQNSSPAMTCTSSMT